MFAQPYYYYNAGTDSTTRIMRFDLQAGTNELFFSDESSSCGALTWDPTQNWLFLSAYLTEGDRSGGYQRFIIEVLNTSTKQIVHRFPDQDTSQVVGYVHYVNPFQINEDPLNPLGKVQSFTRWSWPNLREGRRVLDGIVYNPNKNVFYVTYSTDFLKSDYASWDSTFLFQKTVAYDASTFRVLDTISVPSGWITSLSSVSNDGNYLYVEHWGYQRANAIGKYTLINKQLISNINLPDIRIPGGYNIEDSKKGNFLLCFLYPRQQMEDKKFAIYNIDKDSIYSTIPFPLASHEHFSSDGKYIVIEETPVRPDYQSVFTGDDFLHPGKISIFDGKTGTLIQKLTLPPDGKVVVFDNYPNMLYYYLPSEQRSINIDLSKLAHPSGCNVKLVNSTGTKLTGGALQYYEGSWKDAVNNNDGTFTIATSAKTISLRMTYEYGTQTKSNVTIGYDTIAFQTINAQIQLQNSTGTLVDTGTVQYYSGAWRNFGTTTNGIASKELLTNKYTFRMTYASASNDKQQDISTNPTVVFQTVKAAVQLQNSQGSLIDQGTVQYYSGAWRDLGTTTNGVANKELLPNNYSFRMTFAYASKDKQQDIGTNTTVIFQAVKAAVQLLNSQGILIDTGTVQYYSGSWRDLGTTINGVANKELLPNNYSFRMTYAYASKDKQQDIGTNAAVVFQTVNAAVQLKNSLGNLIDQGTVQYYSGAWRTLGSTTNGTAAKELLPNNYSFRMTYEYVSLDKSQDISANNTVGFSTVLCTIRVTNSQSQLVNNAMASYYSGAWRQIGNTVSGVITKELLPVNLSFRVKYGTQQIDKQQNLSTNNVVEFGIQ
jgi:hypothetical protein